MIYLLSQMVLALILAAVAGGALGWILHRTTQDRERGNLKNVINRQAQQLEQTQSEVAMLTDDYDELQRQAHDELIELRQANQQIPYLSTNLEKSQLLVSQMLKKHESQVRELNTNNQTLKEKLKALEEREQAFNKVQANLDSEARSQVSSTVSPPTVSPPAPISNARNASSWASAPLTTATDTADIRTVKPIGRMVENKPLDEDLDDVHVVVDEDLQGIEDFEPNSDTMELADATISLSDYDFDEKDLTDEFSQTIDNSTVIHLNADVPAEKPGTRQAVEQKSETQLELPELPADVFDVDPFDHVIEIGDDLQKEIDNGTEADQTNAFEPVERNDDLQQIVGIDSVTEKALNDLGITSFTQLAKLKHHEIETIANALKIGSGRIERDDWVGSARRQLEDVLEQL